MNTSLSSYEQHVVTVNCMFFIFLTEERWINNGDNNMKLFFEWIIYHQIYHRYLESVLTTLKSS